MISYYNMKFTQKVWRITDLIKEISKWKHEFEVASDLQKLNESTSFQHLVFHVFGRISDSGLIIRDRYCNDRLHISICKHKKPIVVITFEILHKRKRTPYYFDIIFLDMNNSAIHNQRLLAERVLNDNLLLPFFWNDSNTECKV